MDIRHFRYFLAVARQRNFTRAAEQLGIAPPTLTRQIQDMENELGTRLFVRQTREVSLTEAGAALVIEAEATVRQFEYAQRNAQRAGRGDIGHIELGYVASAVYSGLLQKQVQAFSRECPDVSLNVRESPMASVAEHGGRGAIRPRLCALAHDLARRPGSDSPGRRRFCAGAAGGVLAVPLAGDQSGAFAERDVHPARANQRHLASRRRRAVLRRSWGRNRAGWWR